MINDLIVGIDAGKSGGIAWCYTGGLPAAEPMPDTELDIWDRIRLLAHSTVTATAYIEKVTGTVSGSRASAHTMFTFGRNYGCLLASLYAAQFRIVEVPANNWQKYLKINHKPKSSYGDRKRKLKEEAQKLFPKISPKVTLKTADALLIYEYGRRNEGD